MARSSSWTALVEQARGDLAVEAEVLECLTWQCHVVGRHDDAARYARLGAAAAERLGDPQWIVLLGLAVALAEGKVGRARPPGLLWRAWKT